jgi:hypothetical protein
VLDDELRVLPFGRGCLSFLEPPAAHGAVPVRLLTDMLAPSGMTAGEIAFLAKSRGGRTRRAEMNQLKIQAMAKRTKTTPRMTVSEV